MSDFAGARAPVWSARWSRAAGVLAEPSIATALLFALALHAFVLALPALLAAMHMGAPTGDPWAHWDAVYYVRLASEGYAPYVHGRDHTGLAFLPLYSLLLALPIKLGLPPYVTAMALANLCAVVTLVALALLVRRDCGPVVASRAVLLLAATPAALFLSLGYSESLYLALSVCGFLCLRAGRWAGAAALFGLAAATRPTGVLLALPYLVEWLRLYRRVPRDGARYLAPLLLIPASLGCVMAYEAALGASPLAYLLTERTAWHYAWAWPWVTVARHVAALGHLGGTGSSLLPTGLLNLAATVLALPLLVVVARRLPLSYTAYALAVYLMATALCSAAPFYGRDVTHPFVLPLLNTHRVLLVAFPLAVGAALALRRRAAVLAVVALSALLQVALAILFMNRLWAG